MRRLFNILKFLPAVCLPVMCTVAQAQDAPVQIKAVAVSQQLTHVVSGIITDATTGKSIVGANIQYKELSAAISDSAGAFKIKLPKDNVTLFIIAPGYHPREIALKGKNEVRISLQKEGYESFYDPITMPANVTVRSKVTAAATTLRTDGAWNNTPETPDAYLQGRVAGLQSIRRSGTPNIGANLFLRGFSSLYAASQPLIIVDGVYYDNGTYGDPLATGFYNNPLSFMDVKDIDNITVLKDAASIYGTKAANGAIIITTARAHEEATKIDAAVYGGITLQPQHIPMMDASGYRSYLAEMLQSKGMSATDIQALPYMNDGINGNPDYYRYHNNNNWQDQVFKQKATQNAFLKITGGDNIAKYALSIGYLNNKTALDNTGLTRYNMRFNADLNLSKRLTASTNISYFRNEQDLRNMGLNRNTNPIYSALIKAPFLGANEVDNNGVLSPLLSDRDTFGVSNPLSLLRSVTSTNNSYRFSGAISLHYLLTKDLSLATTIALSNQKNREMVFIPGRGIAQDTMANGDLSKNSSGSQVVKGSNLFNDTRLNYKKALNAFNFLDLRLGVRYNKTNMEQDFGLGFNSATDDNKNVSNGLNHLRQIGGSLGTATWMNMYLNADYNLMDKYLLTLSGSVDGSSRFGHKITDAGISIGGRRYAVMPAVSAAWLLSSENFMSGISAIDLAKIRVSYGVNGNDEIGNNTARPYYVSQNLLGVAGLVRGGISDERLQWEKVSKLNVGMDLALFNERLQLTADVYSNKTDDMIVYQPGPTVTGQSYIITNSGAMKTNGWEATATALLVNSKKVKWQLGFNIGAYKNEVTQLPAGDIITGFAGGNILTRVGLAPNVFYGYKTNGVFASDAAAAASGLRDKNADGTTTAFGGGDMIFVDRNGDKIIDENDMQVIGNPNPDFVGGINTRVSYGNWTLDALATFSQGNDAYNAARRELESVSGYYNQTEAALRRWKADGHVTDMPKATWGDPMGNARFSDRWIEDASYLRLKTVSLSYRVPIKPTAIKYVHIYGTANNLLTFSKYLGYDPEFSATAGVFGQGVDTFQEPQYKYIQLGVRIGL